MQPSNRPVSINQILKYLTTATEAVEEAVMNLRARYETEVKKSSQFQIEIQSKDREVQKARDAVTASEFAVNQLKQQVATQRAEYERKSQAETVKVVKSIKVIRDRIRELGDNVNK